MIQTAAVTQHDEKSAPAGLFRHQNKTLWMASLAGRRARRMRHVRRSVLPTKINFLVAASFALADLPIECDCHIASSA
jgi:hypothetical protein